jgi:hypothetical protein
MGLPPKPTARHGGNTAAVGNRLHRIGGHVAFDGTGEHHADTGVGEVFEITNQRPDFRSVCENGGVCRA